MPTKLMTISSASALSFVLLKNVWMLKQYDKYMPDITTNSSMNKIFLIRLP